MISEEAAIAVEQSISEAISDGAKLLFGGERKGAFFQPTILDYVSPTIKLVTEETFGPVAPVIRVPDMQKAIQITNSTKYGLQAGSGDRYSTRVCVSSALAYSGIRTKSLLLRRAQLMYTGASNPGCSRL